MPSKIEMTEDVTQDNAFDFLRLPLPPLGSDEDDQFMDEAAEELPTLPDPEPEHQPDELVDPALSQSLLALIERTVAAEVDTELEERELERAHVAYLNIPLEAEGADEAVVLEIAADQEIDLNFPDLDADDSLGPVEDETFLDFPLYL